MLNELNDLLDKDEACILYHKEEGKARMTSEVDRKNVREFLTTCIHPLDVNSQNIETILNIYTSETACPEVNVNKSVKLMLEFQNKLPEGFRDTIPTRVIPMSLKKSKSNAATPEYNTELIFSSVMYLMSIGQIELGDIFNYELSPIPTSLYKDTGEARYPKSKSELKNKLKVEVSSRNMNPNAILIDGCAALYYAIYCPKGGKVSDLIDGVKCYLSKFLYKSDVFLIFDRYFDFSIKSDTRTERLGTFLRSHSLLLSSPLPLKETTLKSTKTKVQLIELISKEVIEYFSNTNNSKKLIVTSKADCPMQTYLGQHMYRHDMRTTHEEADAIIVGQVQTAINEGNACITVISEDTDVFALLCHYYFSQNWQVDLFMQGFGEERNDVICIKQTVERHKIIIPSVLPAHALTGCDTVPMMYTIGKTKAISAMKVVPLNHFGYHDSDECEIFAESKLFITKCYNAKAMSSMSDIRKYLCEKKTNVAKLSSKPRLCTLPPTDEALELNIKRAHYQTMVWYACLQHDPPCADPCHYGWLWLGKRCRNKDMVPSGVNTAPEQVLRNTRCNCTLTKCSSCSFVSPTYTGLFGLNQYQYWWWWWWGGGGVQQTCGSKSLIKVVIITFWQRHWQKVTFIYLMSKYDFFSNMTTTRPFF